MIWIFDSRTQTFWWQSLSVTPVSRAFILKSLTGSSCPAARQVNKIISWSFKPTFPPETGRFLFTLEHFQIFSTTTELPADTSLPRVSAHLSGAAAPECVSSEPPCCSGTVLWAERCPWSSCSPPSPDPPPRLRSRAAPSSCSLHRHTCDLTCRTHADVTSVTCLRPADSNCHTVTERSRDVCGAAASTNIKIIRWWNKNKLVMLKIKQTDVANDEQSGRSSASSNQLLTLFRWLVSH